MVVFILLAIITMIYKILSAIVSFKTPCKSRIALFNKTAFYNGCKHFTILDFNYQKWNWCKRKWFFFLEKYDAKNFRVVLTCLVCLLWLYFQFSCNRYVSGISKCTDWAKKFLLGRRRNKGNKNICISMYTTHKTQN